VCCGVGGGGGVLITNGGPYSARGGKNLSATVIGGPSFGGAKEKLSSRPVEAQGGGKQRPNRTCLRSSAKERRRLGTNGRKNQRV